MLIPKQIQVSTSCAPAGYEVIVGIVVGDTFRAYQIETRKITLSKDVTFDKKASGSADVGGTTALFVTLKVPAFAFKHL